MVQELAVCIPYVLYTYTAHDSIPFEAKVEVGGRIFSHDSFGRAQLEMVWYWAVIEPLGRAAGLAASHTRCL